MEEFGVKKIVFSSSCTVFGVPEKLPIDENHPTGNCINPYGRTKFIFEEFLKDICSAHEVYKIPKYVNILIYIIIPMYLFKNN